MSSGPRWSLAVLSLVHAVVLGASAAILPWAKLTVFAVLAGIVAAAHVATAAFALVGSRYRMPLWRITSQASLVFLAYVAYAALGSGFYVAALYDGVGFAILAGGVAAFLVAVLFTVPLAAWGLAATGGLFARRRGRAGAPSAGLGAVVLAVVATFSAAEEGHDARGTRRGSETDAEVERAALATLEGTVAPPRKGAPPQLFVASPVTCTEAPATFDG
ncbi:MAG TPA: hypothetical protein VL400_06605, partial [Polyangiaceae bacterium]|nr:hypothetical protein [Polyangiaceae bacterium]